jgi:hypothetical protein
LGSPFAIAQIRIRSSVFPRSTYSVCTVGGKIRGQSAMFAINS